MKRNADLFPLSLLFGIFLAMALSLNAQKVLLSQLTVNVIDQSGATIPGATISAMNAATGQKATAITSGDGRATLALEPGKYELDVLAKGFLEASKHIDFPKLSALDVTLPISNLVDCGPCVTPMPLTEVGITQTPSETHTPPVLGCIDI